MSAPAQLLFWLACNLARTPAFPLANTEQRIPQHERFHAGDQLLQNLRIREPQVDSLPSMPDSSMLRSFSR
jgi:hypothetical protein